MIKLYRQLSHYSDLCVTPLANLAARIYVGLDFFRAGLLKLDDWEDTIDMFTDDWALPLMPPVPSAYLAAAGELVLPVLLILGLFTRVAALGLLTMAVVIEVFVYPGIAQHYYWMLLLALILGQGGHKLSLDNYLLKV